jgi:pimeloyl-ACP methyl ester carboxylesterase
LSDHSSFTYAQTAHPSSELRISMDSRKITLATKPGASLAVRTYTPDDPTKLPAPLSDTLVVFLNGLASPQSSWKATIDLLLQHHPSSNPALLTYDRYGQGESDPDPSDPTDDTPYGHDATAVIDDLHQLLTQICSETRPATPAAPASSSSATASAAP